MEFFLQVDYQQITPGRLFAIMAGLMGLTSVIIGAMALARAASNKSFLRIGAILALAIGLTGVALSVLHLATTTGGFGTGKGRAGAIVALVIGLTGTALGWRALVRYRRA